MFALHCESIEPSHHVGNDQVQQRGQQSFKETCIARARPMGAHDLHNIVCMVAQGLHDRTRTQQTFPEINELFRRDETRDPKKLFHEVVAEKLIEQLKAGTAPWQKPWSPGEPNAFLPMNPTTGKRYKGINAIHLMAQGRVDSRWMTYKQAASAGAQVRKGEKGTPVQYCKFSEEQDKLDDQGRPVRDANGEKIKETVQLERPRAFFATVFNGEQIDGLPPQQIKPKAEQQWDAVERAEHILQASGAKITHAAGDRAFYRPSTDSITLPEKSQFQSADRYYATALHELGHWTGHPSRLDRDLAHPFGSEGYAKEELRAEISSLIVGEELNISHDPGQHAAYVKSWIKVLEDDPLEIFRASSDAEKIHKYVLAFEQVQEQDQAQTQKLEAAPEQTQEAGMQLSTNNQQMRDQLLSALSQEDSQAINLVANERRRLAAGETDALAFEETVRYSLSVLGFDLPADWNGAVQVQGNVVIEDGGEQFVEPAYAFGSEPEFWSVYAQHEDGMHQWVADLSSQNQADELANLLGLVDALSETNEHEQEAKLFRVNEARKTAEATATLNQAKDSQQAQAEPEKQERTYINVPYREKDEAKGLGARWDRQQQSWFVPPGIDTAPFAKWSQGAAQEAPAQQGQTQTAGQQKQYLAVPYALSDEEKAKLQAEAATKLAEREAAQEQAHEATAQRVGRQMASLAPIVQPTPYLEAKGIKPQAGVLTDKEGKKTYIPVFDADGKQWAMQYIQEDGTKRFAKDSRKESCFHAVGGIKAVAAAPALVIAEGYATAATLAEALQHGTVAAFDSGNLPAVAEALHQKFPDKPVVILGDNDRYQEITQGKNPGKSKAQAAARVVGGKAVLPVFAPGEADYPVDLAPVTPQSYRAHLHATRALETTIDPDRKAELEKALLSKEQQAALTRIKRYTDFNDLATRSRLGREGVERQVRATVNKAVAEVKQKQQQGQQQAYQQQQKQRRTRRAAHI